MIHKCLKVLKKNHKDQLNQFSTDILPLKPLTKSTNGQLILSVVKYFLFQV
jgi:hypothetical protein